VAPPIVKAALSAMAINTDRHDARGLAQLLRLGWFKPVHAKALLAQSSCTRWGPAAACSVRRRPRLRS
jgi:hypothetical protein